MKEYRLSPETIPRVQGTHEQDWVRACKDGQPASADSSTRHDSRRFCLLGNIVKRMDALIEWDDPNMKVTNLPQANQYIRTPYRAGWSL